MGIASTLHPLDERITLDLALAAMLARGLESDLALSGGLGLSSRAIDSLVRRGQRAGWLAALGDTGRSREMGLALTESGRERAREAHSRLGYLGPLPVPLEAWIEQLQLQRLTRFHLSPAHLQAALAQLELPDEFVRRLGHACAAGRAILFHGDSGNGKSAVATAIGRSLCDTVLIPRAIEIDGMILEVFDASVHRPSGDDPHPDPRWVRCQRPFLRVGGELTLDMLEVSKQVGARAPHVPLQWKVAGGVLLIDDFGRQRVPAKALLDRWIIPLERGVDHLCLPDGRVVELPFDALVLFSTNLHPRSMFDAAHLRRVPYRFELGPPTPERFAQIWELERNKRQLPVDNALLATAMRALFDEGRIAPACFQAGFLLDHVLARSMSEPKSLPTPEWIEEGLDHLAA